MKALQRFVINRPITTSMFYLGLILMGILSLSKIEINLLPDLEFPRLTIVTLYRGASPEEVENLVTKPISESVGTVSGLDKISSESLEGLSFVSLQFTWGTNIDFAAMEVREKVDLVKSILPEDISKSVVAKFDPNQSPIAEIVFFSKSLSKPKNLRHFLKNDVKNFLDRIDGVASVQFSGGYKKEIKIDIDHTKMASHNISLSEVEEAIQSSNINYPAGHISIGSKDILVRSMGEYKKLKDIEETIIGRNAQGIPIELSAIATVRDHYQERTGLATFNGKECVIASLYKEAGKNTVQVAKGIGDALKNLRKKFSREISMDMIYDESRFVQNSINNTSQALMLGGAMAFIILILILRNLRSPIILVTAVPISVLTTFILMYSKNITMNMMSMGGLSLGIGMLFDSGNVVLASIELNLQKGLSPKEASLKGAGEVTGSITSAILTTIIVFLPIVFLKGIVGIVFADLALTICFSLGVSLVVSLTLIPMLSSLRPSMGRIPKEPKKRLQQFSFIQMVSKWEAKITEKYEDKLNYFLDHPKVFLWITFILLVVAIGLIPRIEREFIPKVDIGEFELSILNPKGTSLDKTYEISSLVEKKLLQMPPVKSVISHVGYDEEQIMNRKGGGVGSHQTKMRVILKEDRDVTTKEFVSQVRENISFSDDIELNYYVSGDILSKLLSPDSRAITLEVSGDDLSILTFLGERIKKDMGKISGVTDTKMSMEEKDKEYHITFDDAKIASFNFTHAYISKFLRTAIKGNVISNFRVGDEEIDIRLRFQEEDRKSQKKIESYIIKSPDGRNIYLSNVININPQLGHTSILRKGQKRINRITASIEGKSKNEVFDKIQKYLKLLELPDGYNVSFGGEKEELEKSQRDLIFSIILAIVLIYMVLASQFESLIVPVIMICTIPMVIIGIVPSLILTGKSLNISSFIGIILLVGMVVDSASLFYEYLELQLKEGKELKEAILASGKIVLRPILMNTGTTLLGLVPIALELGEGIEFQSPMAITVIGGMITSDILSLIFLPIMFYYLKKWKANKIDA